MKQKRIAGYIQVFVVILCAIGLYFGAREGQKCILTQYSDSTGLQAMFYTVETKEGLIVIDGGWSGNADYVREVINQKGNHVSAWILTHPHPDHAGAFNEIYAQPGDVQIDAVYAIDMDYERYQQYANEWDDFPTYERFCELTGDSEELCYLYEGDSLTLCGLKMEVFNAYRDSIAEFSADYANQGSLVFKLSGEEDSMLFCSDVYGEEASRRLTEKYGSNLASTYIQMGHHGNNTISKELFETVGPKAAFFDAPDWLINGENYNAKQNIEWVQELGAEVYTYQSAPNSVVLK